MALPFIVGVTAILVGWVLTWRAGFISLRRRLRNPGVYNRFVSSMLFGIPGTPDSWDRPLRVVLLSGLFADGVLFLVAIVNFFAKA
jgi:hypothetical protein